MKKKPSTYLTFAAALAVIATSAATRFASAGQPDDRQVAVRLVETFVEAENTTNLSLFDEIFPQNYIQHNPGVAPGLAGVKAAFASEFDEIRSKHIPFHVTAEDIVVDGDRVVLRQLSTYTNHGKTYHLREIDEWRVAGGQLAEHWDSDEQPHTASE